MMSGGQAKLSAGGTRQHGRCVCAGYQTAVLPKGIRGALKNYLNGRRLLRVQVRHIEGNKIEGFLKIEEERGGSF